MSADPVIQGWFSVFSAIYAGTTFLAAVCATVTYSRMNVKARGVLRGDKLLLNALKSALVVWGLTGFLYTWIASGGPSFVRWIVYPFCAAQLFVSKIDLLRLFEKGPRRKAYKLIGRLSYIVVVLTVLPGVIGDYFAPTTSSTWWQIISFSVAFVLQIILIALLWISAPESYRYAPQRTSYIVIMIAKFAWLAYPVLYALRFYFGAISPVGEALGYLFADIVTKIIYKLFNLYMVYRHGYRMGDKIAMAKRDNPDAYYYNHMGRGDTLM